MADNVPISAGTGTNIATDDIGGVHYQIVKQGFGALDTVTLVSSSAGLPVAQQGTWNVTNAGTFVVQENGGALTSLQLIDDPVKADDAAFAVGTDKVMMAGRQAVAHGTNPDAADALDACVAITNRHRVQFVIGGHPNVVSYGMSITAAVTNAIIGPTVNAGTKFVVTAITVILDNASTAFPSVVIGFGTSTAPAFGGTPGTQKIVAGHPAVPAGGGFTRGDGSGIIGVGADDEELRITTVGTATGNGLYVIVTGYTIES